MAEDCRSGYVHCNATVPVPPVSIFSVLFWAGMVFFFFLKQAGMVVATLNLYQQQSCMLVPLLILLLHIAAE